MSKGGYRHGVPGGGAQTHVQIPMTIDVKERWRAASIKAGHHETRGLAPFVIEAVEAYIKAKKLDVSPTSEKEHGPAK